MRSLPGGGGHCGRRGVAEPWWGAALVLPAEENGRRSQKANACLWPELTRNSRSLGVAQAVHNLTQPQRVGQVSGGEAGCCGFRRADMRQVMSALERGCADHSQHAATCSRVFRTKRRRAVRWAMRDRRGATKGWAVPKIEAIHKPTSRPQQHSK